MLAIDGRGGSILLTDGVRVARVSKSLHIGGADLRREHRRGRAPSAERIVDDGFRGRRQDALGKRFRLSEQRPRPEGKREPCIGAIPYGLRRQDVENGEPVDTIRMVKSHAIGDATATIMSSDREMRKSKPLHHGHHVLRHGSLRIWRMVPGGSRAAAAPVAAKIGADDLKVAGKQRRDAAPHQVCLRKAVQQENRRPGPVRAHENAGLTRLDLRGCEVIHQLRLCAFLRTSATICSSSVSPFDGRPLSTLKGLCYSRAMCFGSPQAFSLRRVAQATCHLATGPLLQRRALHLHVPLPCAQGGGPYSYTGTSLRPSSRL